MLYKIDLLIDRVLKSASETADFPLVAPIEPGAEDELMEEGACCDRLPPLWGLRDVAAELLLRNARVIISGAEVSRLGKGKHLPAMVLEERPDVWRIILPDEFLRLRRLRLEDWEESVVKTLNEEEKGCRLQNSRYPGLRCNPERPAVTIFEGALGKALEFHHEGVPVVIESRYIPDPSAAPAGMMELPPALVDEILQETRAEVENLRE